MRRRTAHQRWMGWMALLAVWLTALAPTVSRSIPVFAAPDPGSWCAPAPEGHAGMAGMQGMDAMPGMAGMHHMADTDSPPGIAHAAPGRGHRGTADMDMDAACGYCTLFAQVPALGGVLYVPDVLPVPERVATPAPASHAAPMVARRFAPPRGPPAVLSA